MLYASMQLFALPRRTCERNNFLSEGRSKHNFRRDLKDLIWSQLCDLCVALHHAVISKFGVFTRGIQRNHEVHEYAHSAGILDSTSIPQPVTCSLVSD